MIGFEDPDVLVMDRTSPTPQLTSVNLVLSAGAGLHYEVHSGDIETAFLQGKNIERTLFCSQPKEGETCGTTPAPSAKRNTSGDTLEERDDVKSRFDSCAYLLRDHLKDALANLG